MIPRELWRVYRFAHSQTDNPRWVQIVSRAANDQIFARMVPGLAATAIWIPNDDKLEVDWRTTTKKLYLHVAEVGGMGYFPTDMLRYDMCAPFNHEEQIEDHRFGRDDRIKIYQVLGERKPRWTDARWRSFLWFINPLKTFRLEGDSLTEVK